MCVFVPLIDGLESDLVRHTVALLQEEDDPGRPVRPLLGQVDPRGQAVPVEDDLIGSQQTTCGRQNRGSLRSTFTLRPASKTPVTLHVRTLETSAIIHLDFQIETPQGSIKFLTIYLSIYISMCQAYITELASPTAHLQNLYVCSIHYGSAMVAGVHVHTSWSPSDCLSSVAFLYNVLSFWLMSVNHPLNPYCAATSLLRMQMYFLFKRTFGPEQTVLFIKMLD